jgi:Amt family ammonium transporter
VRRHRLAQISATLPDHGLAVSAFVATHLGAAAAALGCVFAEWLVMGKPTTLGVGSGVVAGLVAITPASGFVGPLSAVIIGLVAGVVCFFAVRVKPRFGYDDALDVVHAVGGIWGALATGLFASVAVNAAGANGLFFGNPRQLGIQAIAVLASISFAFLGSLILLKITDALVGLRVSDQDERNGLDLSEHEENAYAMDA